MFSTGKYLKRHGSARTTHYSRFVRAELPRVQLISTRQPSLRFVFSESSQYSNPGRPPQRQAQPGSEQREEQAKPTNRVRGARSAKHVPYLSAYRIVVGAYAGVQTIPDKQLASIGAKRNSCIRLPYFGVALQCLPPQNSC